MKKIPRALILTVTLPIITNCVLSNTVTIQDAWAQPGFAGDNGAVYFKISNTSGSNDVLIGVKSDVAADAEIHLSKMDDAGTMTMERQDQVSIPANSQVVFMPGELHVMLINLMRDIYAGESFPLTLEFKRAGDVTIDVEVKQP